MLRSTVICSLSAAALAAVNIFGVQEPVAGNETVSISGYNLQTATIQICAGDNSGCNNISALAPTATGIKLILPQSPVGATWAVTLTGSDGSSTTATLGLPRVDWAASYPPYPSPRTALVGSVLTLYGRNLGYDATTGRCQAWAVQAGGPVQGSVSVYAVPAGQGPTPSTAILLPAPVPSVRSCYRLDATLPEALTTGATYDIWVQNGLKGNGLLPMYGAVVYPGLTILAAPSWPSTVLTLGSSPGCDTIPDCMSTITTAGGGTISVPAGTVYMHSSSQIMFPATVPVALVGAGKDATTITWAPGTGLMQGTNPVTSNPNATGTWKVMDLTLSLNAAPQPGAQPVQGMDFVHIPSGSVGARFERVRLVNDLSGYPGIQVGNAVSVQNASHFSLRDVDIVHNGNCASQWPHNTALFINSNSTDFELTGLNVTSYCPGWSITSSSRFTLRDSLWTSVGPVSQGQGINTLGAPSIVEHAYYGNNTDLGNPSAPERWESMTYDGPGGYFNGSTAAPAVVNPNGTQTMQLAGALKCSPWGTTACLPAGLTVAIMRGTGTGQIRRLVYASSTPTTWVTVDTPFDPAPVPGDSYLTVTGYKGQATFEGNTYINGTVFQFYGMAVDTVIAGNTFTEMFDTDTMNRTAVAAGIRLFGHRYVGGYEPNWRNTVLDNALTCTTQFIAYSDNIDNVTFSLGHVFRGNTVAGGVDLAFNIVTDPVAEHNEFSAAYCAWAGQTLPAGTVLVNGTSPGAVVR